MSDRRLDNFRADYAIGKESKTMTEALARDFVATGVTALLAGDLEDFSEFKDRLIEYYYVNEKEFCIYIDGESFLVTVTKDASDGKRNVSKPHIN